MVKVEHNSGRREPAGRPGRALVVAPGDTKERVSQVMQGEGVSCAFADDPYAAVVEVCRRPLVYRMVVLSLQGVYQEELRVIPAIKGRFPHLEVLLVHTDGRQGAMAEGIRLGADGFVSEAGVHRMDGKQGVSAPAASPLPTPLVPGSSPPASPPSSPVAPPLPPPPPPGLAKPGAGPSAAPATRAAEPSAPGARTEAVAPPPPQLQPTRREGLSSVAGIVEDGEPLLTAEELRALLQDDFVLPPAVDGEGA